MTDNDKDAEIGALVKRNSDAKRKRADLVGELGKARTAIGNFRRALDAVETYSVTSETVPRMPKDYPEPAVVAHLLSDLSAACHEIEHTKRLLKDAGVDLS